MARRFAITFDYLCPFARNANEHVVAALRGGADFEVDFIPYSLAQGHVEEGEPAVWDRENPQLASGVLALQVGLVVRDEHPDRFLDVHERLFAARHDEGQDVKEPDVLRGVLEASGVDPAPVFEAIDEGVPLKLLRDEHTRGVEEHQVWGVPTFVTEARAVFVRLMDRPQGDAELARRRIETVLDLTDGALELNEFKQVDLPS